MNGPEHIHPDFRYILGLAAWDRIAFMEQPRWIGYPTANRIIESLRGLMEKPTRPRMPNMLIVGEPNNGKTALIRRFVDLHGQGYVNEDHDPVKPVIFANVRPRADEKSLYLSILEQFWAPHCPDDPLNQLRYLAVHRLRACKTRILVLDGFDFLLSGSAIEQRQIVCAINLLSKELMIPIVGVGTQEAVRWLQIEPQHVSRFDVVSLPLWELNQDFQRLLASFEQVLPLKQPSRLHQPELASMLHEISGGNIGDLRRLLVDCATEAILSGAERIDQKLVASFLRA
jgi:hypothetical protein